MKPQTAAQYAIARLKHEHGTSYESRLGHLQMVLEDYLINEPELAEAICAAYLELFEDITEAVKDAEAQLESWKNWLSEAPR